MSKAEKAQAAKKKAAPKTVPTKVGVASFLNGVADVQQRADACRLVEIMQEITGEPPCMWGPAIVGFGTYHYKYASGHEGDSCLVGFSPRKGTLTLYLMPGLDKYPALLTRLGKHKTSKACLYIKRLSDVDEACLRELVTSAHRDMTVLHKTDNTSTTE